MVVALRVRRDDAQGERRRARRDGVLAGRVRLHHAAADPAGLQLHYQRGARLGAVLPGRALLPEVPGGRRRLLPGHGAQACAAA